MKRNRFLVLCIVVGVGGYLLFTVTGRVYTDSWVQKVKYEKAVNQQKHFLQYMKQDPQQLTYVKRDVEKRLQELKLIETYALTHKITITNEEIEIYYSQELARSKKTEADYLAQLNEMYGVSKEDHLEQIREEILKQRVQEHVRKPLVEWLKEQGR